MEGFAGPCIRNTRDAARLVARIGIARTDLLRWKLQRERCR